MDYNKHYKLQFEYYVLNHDKKNLKKIMIHIPLGKYAYVQTAISKVAISLLVHMSLPFNSMPTIIERQEYLTVILAVGFINLS